MVSLLFYSSWTQALLTRMRKFCVMISTLKLCQRWGFRKTRACLRARRGWYGMRDAGQAFEFAVRDHFLDHDFKQGMFSTCIFAHRSKGVQRC